MKPTSTHRRALKYCRRPHARQPTMLSLLASIVPPKNARCVGVDCLPLWHFPVAWDDRFSMMPEQINRNLRLRWRSCLGD